MIEYTARPLDVMQLTAPLHLCPQTFYGALKASLGEETPECGGIFYKSGTDAFFPAPLGLVKRTAGGALAMVSPLKQSLCCADLEQKDLHVLWAPGSLRFERPGGFISARGLSQYLSGTLPDPSDLAGGERLATREKRPGYPDVYRYAASAEIRFLLDSGNRDIVPAFIRIGGGGRALCVAPAQDITVIEAPPLTRYFKLVFLTPALFEHGWRPRWLGSDGVGKIGRVVCKLVAFVNGAALHTGGWDSQAGVPRRVRAAVRPGSEYYFEVLEGEPQELKNLVHWQCISDAKQKSGFGLCVLGNWRYAG